MAIDPSQFAFAAYVPSFCFRVILYEVIGDPLAVGAVHWTITLLVIIDVVGAAGYDGTNAALRVTRLETSDRPNELRAYTVNLYVVPLVSTAVYDVPVSPLASTMLAVPDPLS